MRTDSISDNFIGKSVQLVFACLMAIPWLLAPQGMYALEIDDPAAYRTQSGIVTARGIVLPAAGGPNIEIWYTDQNDKIEFGASGDPQPQINILGNVSDPDGVKELTYSLNGGSQKDVNFGASIVAAGVAGTDLPQGGMSDDPVDEQVQGAAESDNPRLEEPGDFNIEISTAQLSLNNTIVLRAKDNISNTSSKSITVQYTSGVVPPLPFTVDWSTVSGITDKTQVVDGRWTWNQPLGTIRSQVGYDRLVALGDLSWSEYEVEVPITIHNLPKSNSGGIGLAVRWNGHFLRNDETPGEGWWNLGAYAYYRKRDSSNGGPHLMLRTGKKADDDSSAVKDYDVDYIQEGKTYNFKVRVEDSLNAAAVNPTGSAGYFRFKVWETGKTEPQDWQLEIADGGEYKPTSGSIVLVAYNADISFGEVTVRSLDSIENFDVMLSTEGEGKVLLDSLQGPEFISGTFASGTTLTLVPEAETDWTFANWGGDVPVGKETDDPLVMAVDSQKSLTARFSQTICRLTLTTDPEGSGAVVKQPSQDEFVCGNDVTLTANPIPDWAFAGWTGADVPAGQENQNPLTITMDGDKTINATFVEEQPDQYTLTTSVTSGNGSVSPPTGQHNAGAVIDVTATPADGWLFAGWTGADVPAGKESDNPLTVTMDSYKSITATFTKSDTVTIYLPIISGP